MESNKIPHLMTRFTGTEDRIFKRGAMRYYFLNFFHK